MRLRRTVPFLSKRQDDPSSLVLLVDRVEATSGAATNDALFARLRASVDLGAAADPVPAAEAEKIVAGQYEACLEHIYSHPIWAQIRTGSEARFLRAYLIENRHYLAAAPFRMASGIGAGPRPERLNELQARHVVEEAGHDEFFENGLAELGCARELVRRARPAPVTVEWIHLMRTVAEGSPLAAAVCSGLLEFTAGNRESVAGWHEHLVSSGQLPEAVVAAVFEHVRVDLGLGHGQNWRHALRAAGAVPAGQLADMLNDTTLIAEMIVRWTESLVHGLQGDLIARLEELEPVAAEPGRIGGESAGLPVWPAAVLDAVTHGRSGATLGTRTALAVAFAYSGDLVAQAGADAEPGDVSPEQAATQLRARLVDEIAPAPTATDLEKLVRGWMLAIDGHHIWSEMLVRPTYPLVYGWMVENYHYVAAIWQHCGAAIAACPHPRLRAHLVHHLEEEFEHGAMFRRGIDAARGERYRGLPVEAMRPLATTRAFVGYLRGLAQRDWKAYLLAIAFLQLSLGTSPADADPGLVEPAPRHREFFDRVGDALVDSTDLLRVMRRHDEEDTALDHGDDLLRVLELLADTGIEDASIDAAALVPQLVWGFLDGALEHYAAGDIAVVTRLGWSATRE